MTRTSKGLFFVWLARRWYCSERLGTLSTDSSLPVWAASALAVSGLHKLQPAVPASATEPAPPRRGRKRRVAMLKN
eukprot:scaffold183550_cov12-Tisochrysis_lutea.AAC.1